MGHLQIFRPRFCVCPYTDVLSVTYRGMEFRSVQPFQFSPCAVSLGSESMSGPVVGRERALMILCKFLRQFVRLGTIIVIGPRGQVEQITATETPRVIIRVKTPTLIPKLIFAPNFYFAESYVNGDLQIEEGVLDDLLTILMCSISDNSHPTLFDRMRSHLSYIVDSCVRSGGILRARKQVQYHYDLADDFFKLFLDQNMQYSCAYFSDDLKNLDAAQISKMQHIAAKLSLRPGQRVLDIGSGWGGLAKFLNAAYHVDVTG